MSLIAEARAGGARLAPACETIGISLRCVQRWLGAPNGDDLRQGPKSQPSNKLSPEETAEILRISTSPEYRDLSPSQIVPKLADKGIYIGSESSFCRILRKAKLYNHRSNTRPPQNHRPTTLTATGPNQVYSWDITYLKSQIRGSFFYLYMFVDIWSRKIVGHRVEGQELMEFSAELAAAIYSSEGLQPGQVHLHSDNGNPMKGATMLATLQSLGIVPSFSRPSVSNDNAYSEALFRTLKYRPSYPSRPFQDLNAAREWVKDFVAWYNNEHQHSAIRFVTPASRHEGKDTEILLRRQQVYESARAANPNRWSQGCRNWSPTHVVALNASRIKQPNQAAA
ncbi:MAG: IS3 family transposase [Gammaproteobacteria bacterium]|nr:IS3 family transposase [Gammaproteobacteria bacterium]